MATMNNMLDVKGRYIQDKSHHEKPPCSGYILGFHCDSPVCVSWFWKHTESNNTGRVGKKVISGVSVSWRTKPLSEMRCLCSGDEVTANRADALNAL